MFVQVNVKVFIDESGASVEVPGLLTPAGVLSPLLDYVLAHRIARSFSWQKKVVRSVRMFLEYMHANPLQRDSHLLFANFAERLYTGTFDPITGLDPSGLGWKPRSNEDARSIQTDLTKFFDWLGKNNPTAAAINPLIPASSYDKHWLAIAEQYRRDRSLLGHLWDGSDVTGVRKVRPQKTIQTHSTEPPAFPDERFVDLITNGFRVGNRPDYRGILITLLLHGAGFRESEPFHLYIEDVIEDPSHPGRALVRIHHPSQGFAPDGWRDAFGRLRKENRAVYLSERYGLLPRDKMVDTHHAGWKGGLHDGKYYKQAFWFQPEFGQLFWTVWKKYLAQVACVVRTHPFAFINLTREPLGSMYTIGQYRRAHAAACRRIELEVEKQFGTTRHGHRHAYGRRLSNAGVEKELIRRFMHHSSIESQEVYTQATTPEMLNALEDAQARLTQHVVSQNTSELLIQFNGALDD